MWGPFVRERNSEIEKMTGGVHLSLKERESASGKKTQRKGSFHSGMQRCQRVVVREDQVVSKMEPQCGKDPSEGGGGTAGKSECTRARQRHREAVERVGVARGQPRQRGNDDQRWEWGGGGDDAPRP